MMTDDAEIARVELNECLALLADTIKPSQEYEQATDAVIAVANAFWRAGASNHGVIPLS
jgi:hypothetical protein